MLSTNLSPPDAYLYTILTREAVDRGPNSPALNVLNALGPMLRAWQPRWLVGAFPSGSFAKGTSNKSGTDIDIFASLSAGYPGTLEEMYEGLFVALEKLKTSPKRQNVSIGIRLGSYRVDVVPGRQQHLGGEDHSLFRRRSGKTWTKTNVPLHVRYVQSSGRTQEIRLLKLWRDQHAIDVPSFYLELLAIEVLGQRVGTLSQTFRFVLENIWNSVETMVLVDPANTNNWISDDVTAAERRQLKLAAGRSLAVNNWEDVVR